MIIEDIKNYMDKVFEDYLNDRIGRYTFIGKMCKVRGMLDRVDESCWKYNTILDEEIGDWKIGYVIAKEGKLYGTIRCGKCGEEHRLVGLPYEELFTLECKMCGKG